MLNQEVTTRRKDNAQGKISNTMHVEKCQCIMDEEEDDRCNDGI